MQAAKSSGLGVGSGEGGRDGEVEDAKCSIQRRTVFLHLWFLEHSWCQGVCVCLCVFWGVCVCVLGGVCGFFWGGVFLP